MTPSNISRLLEHFCLDSYRLHQFNPTIKEESIFGMELAIQLVQDRVKKGLAIKNILENSAAPLE